LKKHGLRSLARSIESSAICSHLPGTTDQVYNRVAMLRRDQIVVNDTMGNFVDWGYLKKYS